MSRALNEDLSDPHPPPLVVRLQLIPLVRSLFGQKHRFRTSSKSHGPVYLHSSKRHGGARSLYIYWSIPPPPLPTKGSVTRGLRVVFAWRSRGQEGTGFLHDWGILHNFIYKGCMKLSLHFERWPKPRESGLAVCMAACGHIHARAWKSFVCGEGRNLGEATP